MDYGARLTSRLTPRHVAAKLGAEVRRATGPMLVKRHRASRRTFEGWDGRLVSQFIHPHNSTWRNERAVEIPLAMEFLQGRSGDGFEFGNVLMHYGVIGHQVVDKYEKRPGVMNVDIVDFESRQAADFIVSISTLEHVGWDEHPRDAGKAIAAFAHLRSLLAPEGRMLLTVPHGHHPALDEAIIAGLPVIRQLSYVREGSDWKRVPQPDLRPYVGKGGRGASSLWVAEVGPAEL